MLKSSLFNQSRRYAPLLHFVVEESLQGRGDLLKERTLGVQVFHRDPGYDTAADPIVRVTVAEIRKRIAQYYHDEAHGSELRIELPAGRYVAEFRPRRSSPSGVYEERRAAELVLEPVAPPAPQIAQAKAAPERGLIPPREKSPSLHRSLAFVSTAYGMTLAMLVGVGLVGLLLAITLNHHKTHSFADDFWSSMLVPGKQVTICLPTEVGRHSGALTQSAYLAGDIPKVKPSNGEPPVQTFLDHETAGENVVFSDALASIRIANVFALHSQDFRVRLNTDTTLGDLRQGPAVLIGGLDNQWTLQAIAPLRFRFAGSDDEGYWISDTQNPESRQWFLNLKQEYTKVIRDYALIALVHSEQTGKPQLVVAGIGMSGTLAAGEFLADPTALEQLKQPLAAAVRNQDFEVVLSTDVVRGMSGAPKILAVWAR